VTHREADTPAVNARTTIVETLTSFAPPQPLALLNDCAPELSDEQR